MLLGAYADGFNIGTTPDLKCEYNFIFIVVSHHDVKLSVSCLLPTKTISSLVKGNRPQFPLVAQNDRKMALVGEAGKIFLDF